MSTLFVKFPPTDQVAATAYNDECGVHLRAMTGEVDGIWGLVRVDRNGNWTVPLYGPPWSWDGVNTVAEPPSCAALRVTAVVVETPEWPIED
jgi:hypothetical protein